MKLDALFAFGTSVLTAAVSLFTTVDPHVGAVLQQISTIAGLVGTALHLDGK